MPGYDALLVDLDGTIVDSAPSIMRSLAHAFAEMGREVPPEATLLRLVGPPLIDGLQRIGGLAEADAIVAIGRYRAHYSEVGLLTAPVFPGMAEFLRAARASGRPVALATSKPEPMARRVLEHHGLTESFTAIAGASQDGSRGTKAQVVAEALSRLGAAGRAAQRAVMIGDRIHDVEGAGEHGVPTVLVAWGYGTPDEARHAIAVARDVDELGRLTA